jgi:hypothetical protein
LENKKINSPLTVNDIKSLFDIIRKLTAQRNNVAHKLSSLSENQFDRIFQKKDIIDKNIQKLLGIDSPFGIYSEIRDKVLSGL